MTGTLETAVNNLVVVKFKITIILSFMHWWVNNEFLSPVKIALLIGLCSLVLDLRALDV